jgi:hypothetical protein
MLHKESQLQIACVSYLKLAHNDWLFIKGNFEGKTNPIAGKRERDMGYLRGTPDLTIFPNELKPFFVEFKTAKGTLSAEQKEWRKWAENNKFDYFVCRSLDEFIDITNNY